MRKRPSLIYLLLALLPLLANARKTHTVYWNSTSTIFDISNTDHVIAVDVNDVVSIVCPANTTAMDYEYTTFYLVSEPEYQHCYIGNDTKVKEVGSCTRPLTHRMTFRTQAVNPMAIVFKPNTTYYLITTSTGTHEGMDNRNGGLCDTAQMKIKFEFALDETSRRINPKFAARTLESSDSTVVMPTEDSTNVMYIITETGDEEDKEEPDTASSIRIFSLFLLVFAYLTLQR